MGFVVILILISIALRVLVALWASGKGYSPYIWFFTGIVLGSVGLISLPNTKQLQMYSGDHEEYLAMVEPQVKRGNRVGLILAGIQICGTIAAIVIRKC